MSGSISNCVSQNNIQDVCTQLAGYEVLTQSLLSQNEFCSNQAFNMDESWLTIFGVYKDTITHCLSQGLENLGISFKDMTSIEPQKALAQFQAVFNHCLAGIKEN